MHEILSLGNCAGEASGEDDPGGVRVPVRQVDGAGPG